MKKRIISWLLVLVIVVGIGYTGVTYFGFVSQTIYSESTAT